MTRKGTVGDTEASLKFLSTIEKKYYKEMKTFMRSLGVKYLLSGSNFPCPILPYQYDNYLYNDLIITNDYWDHPQLWKINNDWNRVLYAPINNNSLLKNPASGTINNCAKYKWVNRPFLVTEYNACYPNEYVLEGIPFIAAYSKLQNAAGMLQFDFDLKAPGEEAMSPFTLSKMPDHLAQWVLGAPIFLRGDVKPAKGLVVDIIEDKQLYSLPAYSDFLDRHSTLAYVTKVAKSYGKQPSDLASSYDSFIDQENGIVKSETNELTLNSKKGIFTISTEKIQGAEGSLKDQSIELPFFSFIIDNTWASIFMVAAENVPLAKAKKIYLVAVTPVKMTGQIYNDGRNALTNPGTLPLKAQKMKGIITFNTSKLKKITPLTIDGKRGPTINFTKTNTTTTMNFEEGNTFVYELVLE